VVCGEIGIGGDREYCGNNDAQLDASSSFKPHIKADRGTFPGVGL
jgi:hypothetical protein